jgi:hypothetical protein
VVIPPRSAPFVSTATPAPPSARESERHATSLVEQGRSDDASRAFDALVMANPLYEPRTTDYTPEALVIFRQSQRLQLPLKAQRDYDAAKAAFAGGDFDRALGLAREAIAIIERHSAGIPPDLRQQTERLIDEVKLAAAMVTEPIYSESDLDVRPPRLLSSPLPVSGPAGVPPDRVGWVDIVTNKNGTVAQVKLHTPLNRHHERMFVSAAKAFLFRPAMRNGKPVMYRFKLKITLPESGTDF